MYLRRLTTVFMWLKSMQYDFLLDNNSSPELSSEDDQLHDNDSDDLLEDDQLRLFNGDKDLPSVETKALDVEEVISLLFSPPTSQIILCRHQPRKCQINASFIIDTREFARLSKWKADDLSVFDASVKST